MMLMGMGMKLAFTLSADFSGLCPPQPDETLYIDNVWQKAMVSMQETGVEAAAVTAVVIAADGAAETFDSAPVVIPMVVDHPYFLAIVDVPTGAVLAMGHIVDPTQTGTP
jgi:serpin B